MISKVKEITTQLKYILTATIIAISESLLNKIRSSNSFSNYAILLIAIIGIVILSNLSEKLIEYLINEWTFLRKKLLGKHFIEGSWITKLTKEEKITENESFGLVQIIFDELHYKVQAEVLNVEGKKIGAISSVVCYYDDYNLKYAFEGFRENFPTLHGFGEIQFTLTDGTEYPRSLTAFIQDTQFPNKVILIGRKIIDKTHLKTINEINTRKQIIDTIQNEM